MENYLKPLKEKVRYDFLYIIRTKNKYDVSKLYDIFAELNVFEEIKENNGSMYLEIQSKERIENIYEIIDAVEVENIGVYNLVNNWNNFEATKATKEEKEILYGRLSQIRNSKKTKLPFLAIIGAGVFVLLWFLSKKSIFFYCSFIFLGLIALLMVYKHISENKKLFDVVNEQWLVCECDVVGANTIIYRSHSSSFTKLVFNLAQKDLCLKKSFTGLSIEIGDKVKLFIKENFPFEGDEEEQIYSFNESYIIIPNSFEIPAKIKAKIEKHKLKEKKKMEDLPSPIRKKIKKEESSTKKEEVDNSEEIILDPILEERKNARHLSEEISKTLTDLEQEEKVIKFVEEKKKKIIPIDEDDVVSNLLEIIGPLDHLQIKENRHYMSKKENFSKEIIAEENNDKIAESKEIITENEDNIDKTKEYAINDFEEQMQFSNNEEEQATILSAIRNENFIQSSLKKEPNKIEQNDIEFDLTKENSIIDIWQQEEEKKNEIDVIEDIE